MAMPLKRRRSLSQGWRRRSRAVPLVPSPSSAPLLVDNYSSSDILPSIPRGTHEHGLRARSAGPDLRRHQLIFRSPSLSLPPSRRCGRPTELRTSTPPPQAGAAANACAPSPLPPSAGAPRLCRLVRGLGPAPSPTADTNNNNDNDTDHDCRRICPFPLLSAIFSAAYVPLYFRGLPTHVSNLLF